jgi:hypothetical protein
MATKSKSGGKKKYGRNATQCLQYKNLGKRLRNKFNKVRRHIRNFPEDKQAIAWIAKNA